MNNQNPHWKITVTFNLKAETKEDAQSFAKSIMLMLAPHNYFDQTEMRVYARETDEPRSPSQAAYHKLVSDLGGHEEAQRHIAAQLRRLADHLDADEYPKVFGCSPALTKVIGEKVNGAETIEDYDLTLSHLWGG